MTEQQRLRIKQLAGELRKIAEPVGPMHGLWDRIFDMEAFARDQQTVIQMSAEEWIQEAEALLKKQI